MKSIYVSYSRKDKTFVEQLVNDLLKTEYDIWVDYLKLLAGMDFVKTMAEAISSSQFFILCISPNSIASPIVVQELEQARAENKVIVPIVCPAQADYSLRELLESINLVNITVIQFTEENYATSLQNLLRVINKPKIFISYRRSDSADICDRIREKLADKFGEENVIRDINNIPLGVNFKEFIETIIQQCVVELVIIGPTWLSVSEASGKRRLDNPADFVRLEIEAALKQNISIIPVTVLEATLPPEEELPAALGQLVYRNGIQVRKDPDFKTDMERLMNGLTAILAKYG